MFEKDQLIGQTLGEFEIVDVIGEGGMAVVYRARQPSMNRIVALKVITAKIQERDAFIERFMREAKFLAGLEHPNILPIYSFSTTTNPIYLVMRLINGASLEKYIRARTLTDAQIVPIVKQIASALDFVHQKGVVHRDLKPNNILLDENQFPYLMDVGIARTIQDTQHRLTAEGNLVGTPSYMAPEQWEGAAVDGRTDQYAFGIMVYEMFTGVLPFSGETPFALMYQHRERPLPPLNTYRPDLPDELDAVIRKATEKRSSDRYASTMEFAKAVEEALTHKSKPANAKSAKSAVDLNAPTLTDTPQRPIVQSPTPTRDYVDIPKKRKREDATSRLPIVPIVIGAIALFGVLGFFGATLLRQAAIVATPTPLPTLTPIPPTQPPPPTLTPVPPTPIPPTVAPTIPPTVAPTTVPPTTPPTFAPATKAPDTAVPPTAPPVVAPTNAPATTVPTVAATVASGPTFKLVIFRNADGLSIYIPGTPDNPATVSLKGITLETENARGERIKADFGRYPAFIGLPFDKLPTPLCFNLKIQRSTAALPLECRQLPANSLFQQSLTAANVIWYDNAASEPRPLFLMRDTTLLAQCPAASPDCTLSLPMDEGK